MWCDGASEVGVRDFGPESLPTRAREQVRELGRVVRSAVNAPVRREPPVAGGELLLIGAGAVVLAAAVVTWAGAWLATRFTGGTVVGGLTDWLSTTGRLATAPGDPGQAWGDLATGLPGPALYWACTVATAAAVSGLVAGIVWLWRRWVAPARSRFGVPVDARAAAARDVQPLVVGSSVPPTGRLLLGRLAPKGPLLATEDRERYPAKGRRAQQVQGDRASVALIGPTRSGKSVLAASGILAWDGPVIALSVKRDLYDSTAAARAVRGELAVFDPGAVSGLPTARWTPLRDVTTTSAALRAGRALAQAIPRQGVTGGDFWASHGETLTSAYMAVAGLSQLLREERGDGAEVLTMARLAAWAYTHVGVTQPEVNELIRLGIEDHRPIETRLLARDAMTKLLAFEDEDPKIRASIYATARLAFAPWTEPSVAHSASQDPRENYSADEIPDWSPRFLDLEWLMAGQAGRANTLYLAAPSNEFSRLAPVLGGLLGDIRQQIHAWDVAGRRLSKPLLWVIDEAGQLGLQWLPEEVSTIAGLGAMFVTGWQSRAQINHCYGQLADAVIGGHRSKIIFNGVDDPATLDLVSRVAGTEHVAQRGWSADTTSGRRTISEHVQREDLLPSHIVRQMRRQEAVLLHGTLPPIHLRMVRWWEDKELSKLIPTDDDGRPLPPPEDGTCPGTTGEHSPVSPTLEPSVLRDTIGLLPNPRKPHQAHPTGRSGATATKSRPAAGRPQMDGQTALDLVTPTPPAPVAGDIVVRNRVAGRCEVCGTRIGVGEGAAGTFGGRAIVRCHPPCTPETRTGS